MHTVHNARITLLATAFNNIGIGAVLAGIVAPMVYWLGVAVVHAQPPWIGTPDTSDETTTINP